MIKINPVPAGEEWQIPLLQDLRETAQNNPGFLNTEDNEYYDSQRLLSLDTCHTLYL